MHFEHRVLVEVPFILNVPDGKYDVALPDGVTRVLVVHSGYYAASDDAFEYASGRHMGPSPPCDRHFRTTPACLW